MNIIDSFRGEYAFLSNFYPCRIVANGLTFPSAEHAFQAAKTRNSSQREAISDALSPGAAKNLGRKVDLIPRWNENRVLVMQHVLHHKFAQNPDLARSLARTGDAELIEGNQWGDTFWGVCLGEGRNELGKALMAIRGHLALKEG